MSYVTLSEAAQIVHNETGVDITVTQLIRAGSVQNLPLCVLLDVKCYSPTHKIRREKKAQELDPEYWRNCPIDRTNDADVVYAYGLFVLPPRHVFAYQTKETVRVDSVASLDGQDTYFPGVDVSRDALQITIPNLHAFIARIKASQAAQQTAPAQNTATPAPVETVGASGDVEAATDGPLPLTTGDIAFCFAGLRWNEQQWKKPLGDKPKWLQACVHTPGVQGVSETRWNPAYIGAALVSNGHAKPNSVRAKFQTVPLLQPWLETWKTYEADNFDTD